MLLNLACAEIMAHYRIPHPGISGCGVDWNADLAAGGQRWTSHLPSLRGKSGLASIVGGTLGAKAFSPLLTVYSNDAIGQAVRLADGFRVSDEDLDLDAMADQGSGGSFLTSSLTLGSFREALEVCSFWPRVNPFPRRRLL